MTIVEVIDTIFFIYFYAPPNRLLGLLKNCTTSVKQSYITIETSILIISRSRYVFKLIRFDRVPGPVESGLTTLYCTVYTVEVRVYTVYVDAVTVVFWNGIPIGIANESRTKKL